jgi:hypothetical protein
MKRAELDPLRVLRETVVTPESVGSAHWRSRRVGGEMAAAIRGVPAQTRAARVRRVALSSASVVAVLALGVVALRKQGHDTAEPVLPVAANIKDVVGEFTIARAGAKPAPFPRGARIQTADQLATGAAGGATIELAGGATAVLAARTSVGVASGALAEESGAVRLALREGKVELHVPHIAPGGSLAIVTDDAEVVVHGTVFSVEVGISPVGRRTCVTVSEGIVGVRAHQSETRLSRGQQWSSLESDTSCGGVAPPVAALEEPRPRMASAAPRRAKWIAAKLAGPTPSVPRSAPSSRGTIALENKLFRQAVVALHRGDDEEAIRLFDDLVQHFPDSALAPEAAAQRREAEQRRQTRVPSR